MSVVGKSCCDAEEMTNDDLDDGYQHTHPDLSPRYVAAASYDYRDGDADPSPSNNNNKFALFLICS